MTIKATELLKLFSKAEKLYLTVGVCDEYDRGYVDGVESVRSGVLGD